MATPTSAGLSIQYREYGSMIASSSMTLPSTPHMIISSASANYARLSMLLLDVGTEAAARKVRENLPGSLTVDEALYAEHGKLLSLLRNRVITQAQYDVLFPPSGRQVDEDEIDLTLWVVLLRNITSRAKKMKWVEEPGHWQQKYWHDIQRLKQFRNKLAHNRRAEISEGDFRRMWLEAEGVLLRLGVSAAVISSYLERDLDPERARLAVQEVKDQYLNDINTLLMQRKDHNRKLKIVFGIISGLILASLIVTVVVAFRLAKPWSSCAKNMKFANSGRELVSYIPREGWGARPADHNQDPRFLKWPVHYVIITHTAQVTPVCATTDECCLEVREIQNMHRGAWGDIAFNYVIGGDGVVFIGRGAKRVGTTVKEMNSKILSFGFIGLFTNTMAPTDQSLEALKVYLDYLQLNNVTAKDYVIYGMCQVSRMFPCSPGGAFLKKLATFKHWGKNGTEHCGC